MGVQDRDGWREKQNKLNRERVTARARSSGGRWRLILLVACVLGLAYWLAKRESPPGLNQRVSSIRTTTGAPSSLLGCDDAFPAAGTFAGQLQWHSGAPARSVTTFSNQTIVDRVVDLLADEKVLLSVAVPANTQATIELPVGAHDWRLRAGAAWCGSGWRFVREQRTLISSPLEIVASSQLTVDIAPDPEHPTGFSLRTRDVPVITSAAARQDAAAGARAASGSVLVPRAANGHYYLDGFVDGEPVRFLIDTGATRIAVPVTLARRLGYYQGREVTVRTANGQTTGSEFKVKRITFGPFVAEDVTVVALWDLDAPLLGMSLLQSIELKQTAAGLEMQRAR